MTTIVQQVAALVNKAKDWDQFKTLPMPAGATKDTVGNYFSGLFTNTGVSTAATKKKQWQIAKTYANQLDSTLSQNQNSFSSPSPSPSVPIQKKKKIVQPQTNIQRPQFEIPFGQNEKKLLKNQTAFGMFNTINKDILLTKGQIPSTFANETQKLATTLNKINNMSEFLKSMKDKNNNVMKDAANQNIVKWDPKKLQYNFVSPGLAKKQKQLQGYQGRVKKNIYMSQQLIKQNVSQQELKKNVPVMLQQLLAADKLYSSAGIGPISKNSSPFYMGRWIDSGTGRIRVLPKATNKYLNPLSYNAKLQYLEARLINAWNKYVSVESQLYRLNNIQAPQYQQSQEKKLTNQLANDSKINNKVVNWMIDQIQLSKIDGTFIPKSSYIVITTFAQFSPKQFKAFVTLLNQLSKKTVTLDNIEQINKMLAAAATTTLSKITSKNPLALNKIQNLIIQSYMVWGNKALGRTNRAVIKLLKTAIPDTLTQKQIMDYDKQLQTLSSFKKNYVKAIDNDNLLRLKTQVNKKDNKGFENAVDIVNKLPKVPTVYLQKPKAPVFSINPKPGPVNINTIQQLFAQ